LPASGGGGAALNLLRLGSFLVFLVLGHRVKRAPASAKRARVNALVGYVLGVSACAGFLQWDDWPFSSYHILVGRGRINRVVENHEFYGVDASGGEWRVDPYSWSPNSVLTVRLWFALHFAGLEPAAKRNVLAFLFEKAETARAALAAGRRIGYERRLGGLAAPHFWLAPRHLDAPRSPLLGLRVYLERHVPAARLSDPGRTERELVAEYRP